MEKRKKRFKVKLPSGEFIELYSIKRSKNGFIFWVPHSGKHFTILDEGVALSSHKTDEMKDSRKHIGKLMKDVLVDEDKLVEDMYHPRKLDESEYNKNVIFMHKDWLSFFRDEYLVMKEEENSKEIIQYIDLGETFRTVKEFFERFAGHPSKLMWVGQAKDLLDNDETEYGITEEQKILFEFEGELYEMDTSTLNILNDENPLALFIKPLGLTELLKDIELKFHSIKT